MPSPDRSTWLILEIYDEILFLLTFENDDDSLWTLKDCDACFGLNILFDDNAFIDLHVFSTEVLES